MITLGPGKFYAIVPVPAPRMTRSDKWKQRPCVLKYRTFRDLVKLHGVELPMPCKVTFYIAMPPSWSPKQKEAMDGMPHETRPDFDNCAKALCDALYGQDMHLWSFWSEKRWTRSRPGFYVQALLVNQE